MRFFAFDVASCAQLPIVRDQDPPVEPCFSLAHFAPGRRSHQKRPGVGAGHPPVLRSPSRIYGANLSRGDFWKLEFNSHRYSRVRRLALGARFGVTVRFTVAGVTSLRCDLAMGFALPVLTTVRTRPLLRTVASNSVDAKLADQAGRDPPPAWTGGVVRVVPKMEPEISRTQKPFLSLFLVSRSPRPANRSALYAYRGPWNYEIFNSV